VKSKLGLFLVFVALFALARLPGILSDKFGSFSGSYALVFCAAVYLTSRSDWWIPFGALVITDIALNFYYQIFKNVAGVWQIEVLRYQLFTYAAYAAIYLLGRRFKPRSSFVSLLGGGVLGALFFYLFTNTISWLFNPFENREYTLTFVGWLVAVTKGTGNWPEAWLFFRNTLLSGGLFTALFVAAMKASSVGESAEEKKSPAEKPEVEPDAEPEEAKD
jgi:uncharacterized protein DUF6580